MSSYERLQVDAPPAAVVQALRRTLAERGMTEYAVVDHAHDTAPAGAEGPVAWTLVFGSPAAGARLLALDREAAVDIPLRIAVVGLAGGGSEIVLRNMRSLLAGELAYVGEELTVTMRALARQAADRAAAPPEVESAADPPRERRPRRQEPTVSANGALAPIRR